MPMTQTDPLTLSTPTIGDHRSTSVTTRVTIARGDGIGPEIVAKAFASGRAEGCIVGGCPSVMRQAVSAVDPALSVLEVGEIEAVEPTAGAINVLPTSPRGLTFPVGEVSPASGKAAYDAIHAAIGLAKSGGIPVLLPV